MGYAWKANAEREGGSTAAKIPPGHHRVRISKVLHGDRQGQFQSKAGDPQMMVIFQDSEAREASMFITLSDRAGWVLAKLLDAFDPPANLARMEEDGIEPVHFADPNFADANLNGRELWVVVDEETDDQGKKRLRATPTKDKPAAATNATKPPQQPNLYQPHADTPPAPAADDGPPPATPARECTKDEAWARTVAAWANVAGSDAKQQRNQKWIEAIRHVGKPEDQFTGADWNAVADYCETPF